MTTRRLLLGAAWPYASGPRHVGHLAGAYLPADVIARASRLHGDEVLFVSGSDQYGTPITVAAERTGVAPAELAAANHDAIRRTFARAGITFDHYTSTSSATHHRTVHHLFGRLQHRGLVLEEPRESAWCPRHRRALPDRYVEGTCPRCGRDDARGDQCDSCGATLEPAELLRPRCRTCGTGAELRSLPQLVLALDRLHADVATWLHRTSGGWSRSWVADEAAGHARAGLRGRAISRNLRWGVPIPAEGWDEHRFYVWFDAVIGYLSATIEWAEGRGDPEGWRRWWIDDEHVVPLHHRYVIGKDNVWFHALWWPAILIGASGDEVTFHLPDDIVASHHLTEAGAQLSTSRGHGTTLDDAFDRWGVDAVRHVVAALAPETADSELTAEAVEDATRTGLLGAIANPAHRVASLWWRRFGPDPVPAARLAEREAAQAAVATVGHHFREGALRKGLAVVHGIGRTINQRLAADEPWRLPADEARDHLASVFTWVDALALTAWPIVPSTAGNIRSALGRPPVPGSWTLPEEPVHLRRAPDPPFRPRDVHGHGADAPRMAGWPSSSGSSSPRPTAPPTSSAD